MWVLRIKLRSRRLHGKPFIADAIPSAPGINLFIYYYYLLCGVCVCMCGVCVYNLRKEVREQFVGVGFFSFHHGDGPQIIRLKTSTFTY